MHILLLSTVSLQTATTVGVLLIILILLLVLFQRQRRRRPRSRHQRISHVLPKRRDHGAEVAARHGHQRSPEWPRVAKEHLLREPACVACGHRGEGLQVHHIKPFHLAPQLELDPSNLITLCEVPGRDHHLLLGHLDDWEAYNPHVHNDVKRFHRKNAAQIRADPRWQKEEKQRPFQ